MVTMQDVVAASNYLVKPEGVITIIFPAKRLIDLLDSLRRYDIKPKRLRMIYSSQPGEGKLVIIEGGKRGNQELVVGEPFFIYNSYGGYSEEMQKIYNEI